MIKRFDTLPQPINPSENCNITFEKLKEFGTVYVLEKNNKIEEYDLNKSPKSLFDVSQNYFSDGFGGSWCYKDYNKTWSDNKIILYEQIFEILRNKAEKFDNIFKVLSCSFTEDMKIKIISAYLNGFYGTMYGGSPEKEKVLFIEPSFIGNGGKLYYIWGWPGPDFNIYEPKQYGKTWALTKEELTKQ
jgi:hypothetical protein